MAIHFYCRYQNTSRRTLARAAVVAAATPLAVAAAFVRTRTNSKRRCFSRTKKVLVTKLYIVVVAMAFCWVERKEDGWYWKRFFTSLSF